MSIAAPDVDFLGMRGKLIFESRIGDRSVADVEPFESLKFFEHIHSIIGDVRLSQSQRFELS